MEKISSTTPPLHSPYSQNQRY
jgi:hypothetical protein